MSKVIFVAYVLATSLGLIALKLSTAAGLPIGFAHGSIYFNLNIYTVAGVLLYGTSFLLYLYLISKFSLGYIIPITTALVYVLVFIASFLIFKEPFTLLKVSAIILIMGGLFLLNMNKKTAS